MGRPILIASAEGGMEIEEVAQKSPEKIIKVPIQANGKVRSYHLIEILKAMEWSGDLAKEGKKLICNLAKAFMDLDGELLEINPLIKEKNGGFGHLMRSARSMKMQCTAILKLRSSMTPRSKRPMSGWRKSIIWPILDLREKLGVWSMVQVLPWLLWISFSTMEGNQPTF